MDEMINKILSLKEDIVAGGFLSVEIRYDGKCGVHMDRKRFVDEFGTQPLIDFLPDFDKMEKTVNGIEFFALFNKGKDNV